PPDAESLTLSLHDALPISSRHGPVARQHGGAGPGAPGASAKTRGADRTRARLRASFLQRRGRELPRRSPAAADDRRGTRGRLPEDRKSTRLNSSHVETSYA